MQLIVEGIVLKEVKVGEADRILTILTKEHGVISASAKRSMRIKSKLATSTELLCWSEFTLFKGRTMYSINDAQVQSVFFELRSSIEVLSTALYLAELTSLFAMDETSSKEYFDLLLLAFQQLCKPNPPYRIIKSAFELRLLSISGYQPDIVACKECGQYEESVFYFSVENGDLLCASCLSERDEKPNLTLAALQAMRYILFSEENKFFSFTMGEKNLKNLNEITDAFVQYHVDKPMKSHLFLMQLLKG